jgi:hypothetical protein
LRKPLSLLLADTDGATTATGGLGVLTTDTETPVVTETAVRADLLEALEILTVLAVETVGKDLVVLAIDDIALSVQEPGGDLVLGRVLEDGDNALEFFGGKFTGTLVEVNIGLLADQVGVTATDTLDLGQGVHDLLLAVNIGVEQTKDVLEVRLLAGHERCEKKPSQPNFLAIEWYSMNRYVRDPTSSRCLFCSVLFRCHS